MEPAIEVLDLTRAEKNYPAANRLPPTQESDMYRRTAGMYPSREYNVRQCVIWPRLRRLLSGKYIATAVCDTANTFMMSLLSLRNPARTGNSAHRMLYGILRWKSTFNHVFVVSCNCFAGLGIERDFSTSVPPQKLVARTITLSRTVKHDSKEVVQRISGECSGLHVV